MQVALRIHDPAGTASRDVVVHAEDGGTVSDLIEALVDALDWPRTTFNGEQLVYFARLLGSEKSLDRAVPVSALDLVHGAAIVLGPEAMREEGAS